MSRQRSVPWKREPVGRTIRALLLGIALLLVTPSVSLAADCQFVLGFKSLRDLIGHDIVGECLDNEHYNVIGDSNQHTTGGLLAWRKADNWTAFTDGYRTWVNGPNGLQQRLNTERFEWEADYAPGGGIATPTPAPTTPPTQIPQPARATFELNPAHILEPVIAVLRTTPSGEAAYQTLLRFDVGIIFGGNPPRGQYIFDSPTNRIVIYGKYFQLSPEDLARYVAGGAALAKYFHEHGEPTTAEQCIQQLYLQRTAEYWWREEKTGWRSPYDSDEDRYAKAQIYVASYFKLGDAEEGKPTLCPMVSRTAIVPTPAPIPTPAPSSTRFVDPLLVEAMEIMRTTEFGEIMYQAYLGSSITYMAFAHLELHGAAGAEGVHQGYSNRILLDEKLREESHYVRVAVLVHELFHARPARDYSNYTPNRCFEEETLAFSANAKWWFEKFGRNGKDNPTVAEERENSNMEAWLAGRIGAGVRQSEAYQEQCAKYEN